MMFRQRATRARPRWMNPKTWLADLDMDVETLLMMMKGALVPTLVVAISQSSAVANVTTSAGYLAALISVSAQSLQPRAKFLRVIFFCLLALGVTVSLTCLAVVTAVAARDHDHDGGRDLYDGSASAVAAIWLFVMIWLGNSLRAWRMADLQDAVVASSIFAVVVLTRAGNWPTAGEGLHFAVRILKTFLVGFAVATGVSLLVLPRTCRGVVFKDVRGFVAEAEAVMEALEGFVTSASRTSFLTRQRTRMTEEEEGDEEEEEGFAGARAHLAKASGTLDGLEAKLRADLKYARSEVAWGKLSATDLDEVSALLRGLLLPLSGMSLLPSMVDGFAEAEEEAAAARSGRVSSSSTAREEEEGGEGEGEETPIDGSIDALAQCLGDTRVMVGAGMHFFLRRLELAGEGSGGRRRPDVEAATATPGLDVSSPDFVESFRSRVGEMAAAKEKLRADGFVVRGSGSGTDDDDMAVHRDLLLVLYLFNLQAMMLDATLDLIVFADKKTSDGTMSHGRLIHPPFPSFSSSPQPTTPPPVPSSSNQNVQGIQVIDPVHLSPSTPLERSSSALLRPLARLVGSDLSMFGLRVAAASLSIGVVAFLHASHAWFIEQRGVWGMIVVVIGMGPTTGQSFFGFFMRIAATALALCLSFVAWYVVGGRTPGVVVFLFVANVIEYYTYVKKPHLFGPSIIAIVTLNIIIAYELQVAKIGITRAESNGQPYLPIYQFGPYKLATVAVGCAVSFFWTVFPYPITAKSKVPRLAGRSLFNLARYYSAVHAAVDVWVRGSTSSGSGSGSGSGPGPDHDPRHLRALLTDLHTQQILALDALRINSRFAAYEPPVGGKFPSTIYASLTTGMQRIVTILALMAHTARTSPSPSPPSPSPSRNHHPRNHLAAAWATADTQFQATTSLFCHLASSLSHATPLPPFLAASEAFPLVRRLHREDPDLLRVRDSYRPDFTAFVSLELLRTALNLELQKQLE